MSLDQVFAELSKLSRVDKLRAMQFLANELAAAEEALISSQVEYHIYTPLGNETAAQTLWNVLQEAEAADQGEPQD